MTEGTDSQLEQLRNALFGVERQELASLQAKAAEVDDLRVRVAALEDLVLERTARAAAVGEVMVDAVASGSHASGDLGGVLRPEIEAAVRSSAREDSGVLAEALYPVMGPALRKMIAALFTVGDGSSGDPFSVEQVLLIERRSGVMLAGTAADQDALGDADVVSGMLDAIRHFVQDAFEVEEHDGLRDLRVGDLAILVEWGPAAVLASVVRGVASDAYRDRAALTLERVHSDLRTELSAFDGRVAPFSVAEPLLTELHNAGTAPTAVKSSRVPIAIVAVVLIAVVLVVLLW